MSKKEYFKKMEGFQRLSNLWRIEYRTVTLEPFLTRAVSDEMKDEIGDLLGKTLPKPDLDAVPLVIGDKAVVTGNAVKGLFRHMISAQLTEAKTPVCVQKIKVRPNEEGRVEGDVKIEGRIEECKPGNPCFVCTWFGTPSRQGALHFSFVESMETLDKILIGEPLPMVALAEDSNALIAIRGTGRFALLAPVKKDVEFSGWINGENLSEEIVGAIKEVQDMSGRGFIQFGGFKTRGFGTFRIEITKVEKYGGAPFKLEKTYQGDDLKTFLGGCQRQYHEILSRGKTS